MKDVEIACEISNPEQTFPDLYIVHHDAKNCITVFLPFSHVLFIWTDEKFAKWVEQAYCTVRPFEEYLSTAI